MINKMHLWLLLEGLMFNQVFCMELPNQASYFHSPLAHTQNILPHLHFTPSNTRELLGPGISSYASEWQTFARFESSGPENYLDSLCKLHLSEIDNAIPGPCFTECAQSISNNTIESTLEEEIAIISTQSTTRSQQHFKVRRVTNPEEIKLLIPLTPDEIKTTQFHCACANFYGSRSDLSAHLRKEHCIHNIYYCPHPKCDKLSTQAYHLAEHIATHTNDKPYKCRLTDCQFVTAYPSALASHLKRHLTLSQDIPMNLSQNVTTESTEGLTNLEQDTDHISTYLNEKPITNFAHNLIVPSEFESLEQLRYPESLPEPCLYPAFDNTSNFRCTVGNSYPSFNSSIESLLPQEITDEIFTNSTHPNTTSANSSIPIADIQLSPKEIKLLKRPTKEEIMAAPFHCACSNFYGSRASLFKHLKQHHAHRKKDKTIYRCPACNYFAFYCSTIARHMLQHTKDKPFKCPLSGCPYYAGRVSHFSKHFKCHLSSIIPQNNLLPVHSNESLDSIELQNPDIILNNTSLSSSSPGSLNQRELLEQYLSAESENTSTSYAIVTDNYLPVNNNIESSIVQEIINIPSSNLTQEERLNRLQQAKEQGMTILLNCACNAFQGTYSDLYKHIKKEHTNSTGFYQCPYNNCDMSRPIIETIVRHIMMHTKEKPFKCLDCCYETSIMGNLKRHYTSCHA